MTAPRQPLRPISWWWTVLGVAAVTAAISISMWALLAQTHGLHGQARAQARIEAIKTALTAGAGAGGAVALFLALRRQWLSEHEQIHREEVDAAAEHDATERRITELYVKAVDQLGSDQAAVRLGGLYALERLGQNNHDHRQTVVNVICAYLRMPYTPPGETRIPNDPEDDRRREELQVRKTAQRILAHHLRDETYVGQRTDGSVPDGFWLGIELLDLTGACLVDFDLIGCRVKTLQFNHASFCGETVFRGTICDLGLFQGSTFSGLADFRGVSFAFDAWFSYSTFATEVWFHGDEFFPGARFGGHASFQNVAFARGARFSGVIFAGSTDFHEARYDGGTETIRLAGARVDDLTAAAPDASNRPSNWPPAWVVEPNADGTGTLTWVPSPDPTRH